MGTKTKLDACFRIINFGAYPNKKYLNEEHKTLLSLLDMTLTHENCEATIKKIKENQIYKLFKLDKDTDFLKSFFIKTSDPSTLQILLKNSDIVYSEQEKNSLRKSSSILTLLLSLETELKEVALILQEFIAMLGEKDFFKNHFQELDKLKETFLSDTIEINHIQWFFTTDIFNLMTEEPKNFTIKTVDIYDLLIQDINLYTKNHFNQHCQILLDKKTEEGENFHFDTFYAVLCDKRQKFKERSEALSASFYQPPKQPQKSCNTLVQQLLKNRLKKTQITHHSYLP